MPLISEAIHSRLHKHSVEARGDRVCTNFSVLFLLARRLFLRPVSSSTNCLSVSSFFYPTSLIKTLHGQTVRVSTPPSLLASPFILFVLFSPPRFRLLFYLSPQVGKGRAKIRRRYQQERRTRGSERGRHHRSAVAQSVRATEERPRQDYC